ncbi:MAG TPA: aspartate/glutamate racemase family protein [Anaerolineales bacterium]|nr:aspartate/glutamate racemase family protein [Anaerolineales bacterium]
MNITVINGNISSSVSEDILQAARLAAFPGTEITMLTPEIGPATIGGYLDAELSAMGICDEIARANQTTDAFVIACFSDPGLFAAREMTSLPVIGIAQASMVTALQLGHSFSLLSPMKKMRPILRKLAVGYGFQDHLASIQTVEMSVAQAAIHGDERMNAFLQAGTIAMEKDGAEVLILAGAVMAGMEKEMMRELGIPVLDPVKCAMIQAQGLVAMQLLTSKKGGFSEHRPKKSRGAPSNLANYYL